jgi:hypothetical protein
VSGIGRWWSFTAIGLALLGPASASAAAANLPESGAGAVKRFALVIGNNRPPQEDLATLRYADDDAIRWAVLLRTLGAEVEILTDLDADSARLYGADAPEHRSPDHKELESAMARLNGRIQRARANGSPTVFFFIYAGHGGTKGGEGYIGLNDGPFFRHELEKSVLAVSSADTNHVIIDACRSVFLAYDRGPGGSRRPWPKPYFSASAAARFPNTGFLLASSSGGATHEWEEFQAGIFSHELRSGLLGGADADGDGRITYRELSAFVLVANQAVRNERFRPEMLAHPPQSGDGVLVDIGTARDGRVHFGAGHPGRLVLEDGLGIRWADVNPGRRQNLTLLLPSGAGGGESLYLRTEDGRVEYPLHRAADVQLAEVVPRQPTVSRRGAMHEAFSTLFTTPFDSGSLQVALAADPNRTDLNLVSGPFPADVGSHNHLRPFAISLAAGSLVAFAGTGALYWSTQRLRASSAGASMQDRPGINTEIDDRNHWTIATVVTGAVLAAAAAGLFLWDRSSSSAE